jgi:hypothetical protein
MHDRGHGCPEALLLAWVAWEGLRIRVLVVALSMHGWRVKGIYPTLASERLTAHASRKTLNATLGCSTLQVKTVADIWRAIESHRPLRNKFAHGMGGNSPDRLEAATHFITTHALDPEWLAPLPVHIDDATYQLGDPYRRLHARTRLRRSAASLRQHIGASVRPR